MYRTANIISLTVVALLTGALLFGFAAVGGANGDAASDAGAGFKGAFGQAQAMAVVATVSAS